jgi:hypothetical protein
MHSHRIELFPTAPLRPSEAPEVASVQALGLSDVLRVELQPCQLAGLIDEVDERRGPLRETFENARARWEALSRDNGIVSPSAASDAEAQLSSAAYALRVLAAIRSQIPIHRADQPFALVGPAITISEIITAAARNTVDELAELLRAETSRTPHAERYKKLRELTSAAQAWVETYVECHAVEWYRFDPEWDPVVLVH